MRSISAALLAKAQADDGHESSVVLELDTGSGKLYLSEREIAGTDDRIMEVASLNAQMSDTGSTVGSVNVKLSDEDEYFLNLMCTTRLEGRNARLLLVFDGDMSDTVELFAGRVGSPLVWEEGQKTLSFDVVAFYESGDNEVPFTPDEDSGLQEFAWDREWPRVYGTPVDVPAVLVVDAPKGVLIRELRPLDSWFEIEVADNLEFPTGEEIEVDVGNERIAGKFTVVRTDPTTILRFHIQSRNVSKGIVNSQNRDVLTSIEGTPEGYLGNTWAIDPRYAAWDADGKILAGQWLFLLDAAEQLESGTISTGFFNADNLYGIVSLPSFVGNKNYILYQEGNATRGQLPWITASGLYLIDIGARADIRGVLDVNDTLWAAGTPVRQVVPVKYVCSDIPAEAILQVRAWREVKLDERGGSKRELVVVPPSFYTVDLNDELADRACTTIEFEQPLSSRGSGWGDEVYVTLRSSYGPNIAEIIEHLLWEAGLTVDTASFDAVEAACDKYPMHFAILSRRDALELAHSIAFQGRCGLVVLGSTAYIKYLSLAPTSVAFTYGVDQVLEGSLQLTSSETTEVSNDLWVTWKKRYSQESPERIHFRNEDSIEAFGRKKRELEIFAYRHKSLVRKTAQFWFNRWSRVWRKLRVVGDLDAIAVTIYDDVKSIQPELILDCVVEMLEHNTEEDQIAALLWTPAEVGSCEASDAAFLTDDGDAKPAALDLDNADDVAEVIEVSPLDLSLSEPETHVAEALDDEVEADDIGATFNAKLYKSNTTTGDVKEQSVEVRNLSDTAVRTGDVLVVHKAEDGTYYTLPSVAGSAAFYGQVLTVNNTTRLFTADLYETQTNDEGTRVTTLIVAGATVAMIGADANLVVGDVVLIFRSSDGTYWSRGIATSPFAAAVVKSDAADKNDIPCRLYLSSDFSGPGDSDISVKTPALQTTAKISAGTWLIVFRIGTQWVGYLPLIRPRVPA